MTGIGSNFVIADSLVALTALTGCGGSNHQQSADTNLCAYFAPAPGQYGPISGFAYEWPDPT
jgi:hypothetical protein